MDAQQFLTFAFPLPEPTLLLSGDGIVLAGNPAVREALGIDPAGIQDRPLADVSADPAEEVAHYLTLCARSRSLVVGALSLRDPEGTTLGCRAEGCLLRRGDTPDQSRLLLRLTPKSSAAGQFIALNQRLGELAQEVRRRQAAEEAARESEGRFRELADAMPQIAWTANADGAIDYLNRRWTEFTGLPQTVSNDAWGGLLHADEAPAARSRWAASLERRESFEMPLRLLTREKGTYRWHLLRTVPVADEHGRVSRWFGTATDIDDQKRAEESARYLSAASAALASIVDYKSTLQKVANLAVPFFADWAAVDVVTDGRLERLAVAHKDPARIELVRQLTQEYPPDPGAPRGTVAVLRTGRAELMPDIPDDLLEQTARDPRHLQLIRSLGLKSYIAAPLVDSTGTVFGVLTFATAESGRRYTDADLQLAVDLARRAAIAVENTRLVQALRESDKRKDEFLAILAHELRNPLAPLSNSLQILGMRGLDPALAARARDMMARQLSHLVRLVDDLMDVARVMQGKIELRRVPVGVASIVARAIESVQPLADAHGHRLELRLPPDPVAVDADPVRLAQVVSNLLTNAIKYTPADGRILLAAEREGDAAVLRVRDNGIGIAPEMQRRIFEMFVQGDQRGAPTQGGLGIGLTLVKNLVEMHGGTVEARSEGSGRGSEFVIRLPVSKGGSEHDRPGRDASPTTEAPQSSGHRVLVVDDNHDAAESLAVLLRLQGHDVRVEHGGEEALHAAATYAPHVIFLDIGMPGLDGYEVARRLRKTPGFDRVVLAALTGWGQQEDRRRSLEVGFDHHIVKPPEPKAVDDVFRDVERRSAPHGPPADR